MESIAKLIIGGITLFICFKAIFPGRKTNEKMTRCPHCQSIIPYTATVCPYCRREASSSLFKPSISTAYGRKKGEQRFKVTLILVALFVLAVFMYTYAAMR